jgi:hypothetical protein
MHLDTKIVPAGDHFAIDFMNSSGLRLRVRGGAYLHPQGYRMAPGVDLTLAASSTSYVEAADNGAVTANVAGFTASATPLYVVTTGADVVTGIEDHRGSARPSKTQTLTASGAIRVDAELVILNHATVGIAATIAAPRAGRFLVITQTDAGTAGHTVTLAAGTWNGSNTIATLNAAGECLIVYGVSATRFMIMENLGAVAFSGS